MAASVAAPVAVFVVACAAATVADMEGAAAVNLATVFTHLTPAPIKQALL